MNIKVNLRTNTCFNDVNRRAKVSVANRTGPDRWGTKVQLMVISVSIR